jgi:hypothetical protein
MTLQCRCGYRVSQKDRATALAEWNRPQPRRTDVIEHIADTAARKVAEQVEMHGIISTGLLEPIWEGKAAACGCDFRTQLLGDGCFICNPGQADALLGDGEMEES